jgi:hypothetical protein
LSSSEQHKVNQLVNKIDVLCVVYSFLHQTPTLSYYAAFARITVNEEEVTDQVAT